MEGEKTGFCSVGCTEIGRSGRQNWSITNLRWCHVWLSSVQMIIIDEGNAINTLYWNFNKTFNTIPQTLTKGWSTCTSYRNENCLYNHKKRIAMNDRISSWSFYPNVTSQRCILAPFCLTAILINWKQHFKNRAVCWSKSEVIIHLLNHDWERRCRKVTILAE